MDSTGIYGWAVRRKLKAMAITQLISAPRSPWQNAFVERVIGSIRRECTDHIIPLSERHLLSTLREYQNYYNGSQAHQALGGDSPIGQPVQPVGGVIASPILGGLPHTYSRAC